MGTTYGFRVLKNEPPPSQKDSIAQPNREGRESLLLWGERWLVIIIQVEYGNTDDYHVAQRLGEALLYFLLAY